MCVIDSFLVSPLIEGLDNHFKIIKDNPQKCVQNMLEGQQDIGILSSLDYAMGKGNWRIIPDVCIAGKGAIKTINLFFNRDIRTINKVAIEPDQKTSNALLKIILSEKYEISPEFISIPGNLAQKLELSDAALLTGESAFNQQQSNEFHLDLGEEWYDLTGLPFVYALWIYNDLSLPAEYIEIVKDRCTNHRPDLEISAKKMAKATKIDWLNYYDLFTTIICYHFGNEEREGLNEFFRYAFFYGIIEHIPDLRSRI